MSKIPINHFDRSKLFYPLVMNYLYQLIGFRDMAVQGLCGSEPIESKLKRLFKNGTQELAFEDQQDVSKKLLISCGPLKLLSVQQNEPITIDIDEISQEALQNMNYLGAYMLLAAGNLLVLAYEFMKEIEKIDKEPICEFLRHCRNAASHGGRFYFQHGEPKRPSAWGKLSIDKKLEDTPLFRRPDGKGLLGPGDPIRLLWDIEQIYTDLIPPARAYDFIK